MLMRMRDGAPDDGTSLCHIDPGPSSYYDGGPYDYVFGLADRFHDIVHAVEQPLRNDCIQSQLTSVAELKDNIDLDYCKFCGKARNRNKIPYPIFSRAPLGLCTNGFAPHRQYGHTYSCWPVILTPYNLPWGMCMSSEYMFLTMVIPGPSNLKRFIDVYLKPLIEELQNLWNMGVLTHDNAKDETSRCMLHSYGP
ncbi:UNVERIFIED_CONTAM: hypothetical protein Slati_2528200 [Sesamum latifolium]|uniref:Uncharacterized protein n=1 Tax=Sesamum latifolium TaxID=2727402 RepID=A0AAW2WFP5_9LAMI